MTIDPALDCTRLSPSEAFDTTFEVESFALLATSEAASFAFEAVSAVVEAVLKSVLRNKNRRDCRRAARDAGAVGMVETPLTAGALGSEAFKKLRNSAPIESESFHGIVCADWRATLKERTDSSQEADSFFLPSTAACDWPSQSFFPPKSSSPTLLSLFCPRDVRGAHRSHSTKSVFEIV